MWNRAGEWGWLEERESAEWNRRKTRHCEWCLEREGLGKGKGKGRERGRRGEGQERDREMEGGVMGRVGIRKGKRRIGKDEEKQEIMARV